jgi:hypothetical protein
MCASLAPCLRSEEDGAAKVADNRRHTAKRKAELQGVIHAAAANSVQHAAVLAWSI